jgi:serine/threonine protein kinase
MSRGSRCGRRSEAARSKPCAPAAILRQIGAALDAVHAAGVAHCDLKPENVMLQPLSDGSEQVKLIDFGIAKLARARVCGRHQ